MAHQSRNANARSNHNKPSFKAENVYQNWHDKTLQKSGANKLAHLHYVYKLTIIKVKEKKNNENLFKNF